MSQDLFDLSGRTAIVTGAGANGGLGHAMAIGLARHGADVVVPDIDSEGSAHTAAEIQAMGRRSLAFACDVSDATSVAALFEAVDSSLGRVDILVNNAYAFPSRALPEQLDVRDWERTLAVCLTGYFLCAQQAITRMISQGGGGAIVNISSIAGVTALGRGNMPYSVAKGGINQLTRELAVETAAHGIRVNAILPAQVETPGFRKWMENPRTFNPRLYQRLVDGIPMNRLLAPEEFVGPLVFLCSPASAAITGALLPVDGGNLAMNATGTHTWLADQGAGTGVGD